MTQKLPEVRIRYAFLLSNAASKPLNELWGDGTPLQSFEFYTEVAKKYAGWWSEEGEAILKGLYKITGLQFYQNTIDVHVAPWFYAFSNPMVVGVIFRTKDEFINVLTHEMIHRLLTDNTTYSSDEKFVQIWRSMFGNEISWNTLVHIPVHAIMQELYLDVINRPDLLELDKATVHKHNDEEYKAAWSYVEDHGHKWVTDKIRAHARHARVA